MATTHVTTPTAALLEQRMPASLGRDNLLSLIESIIGPSVYVFSLWALAYFFDGSIEPPYLLLSIMVFAVTFPGQARLQSSIYTMILDITLNWIGIAGLLLVIGITTGYIREFSQQALFTWLWFAPATEIGICLALRVAAPALLRLQGPKQRAIVVGMNEQGLALAARIKNSPYSWIDLVGFVDSRSIDRLPVSPQHKLLGNLEKLVHLVQTNHVQLIYLSLPMASQPRILQVLDELKDTTVSIYFVPDMFLTDLIQGRPGSVCGTPIISVCDTPFKGASGAAKRLSDIVLSALILVLISPVLLGVALGVKLSSPGPIIFKQRRYGQNGEEILIYKFRSMTVTEDGSNIQQAQKDDQRITRLGAFIRKTSLDELPQFINVLQGRMSIVGPRPHAVAHNELYRKLIKGYMVRHKVKPGITGWAQVNGFRGETNTLDKMQSRIEFDLDYLRNWSLVLDIKIILKTIRLVFKDQQAY
ncbi:MAG: undecaprenyl-phosphate glucose phosphotransferase [Rhodoferax ferrireducens]|uniref:Undecaprenyl-phosphate glucose phosphotransferase n=1 Tax=Rhodoferax ferrireducens TaxID=192843 RepID=A0A1W9KQZ6_9BURK|nr:MAG: undecaprenyl-phosphate glucose phosphotransferase [Rhodoferax ferrireducens]